MTLDNHCTSLIAQEYVNLHVRLRVTGAGLGGLLFWAQPDSLEPTPLPEGLISSSSLTRRVCHCPHTSGVT